MNNFVTMYLVMIQLKCVYKFKKNLQSKETQAWGVLEGKKKMASLITELEPCHRMGLPNSLSVERQNRSGVLAFLVALMIKGAI